MAQLGSNQLSMVCRRAEFELSLNVTPKYSTEMVEIAEGLEMG